MIGGSKPRGYTVVEVLIFLAVTSILGVSAMTLINGQQRKTEFAQTAREFDSTIRDIINDVSTGYYPNTDKVKCESVPLGSGVQLSEVATSRGTNSACIFIGRVIQFAPASSNRSGIRVHTVAGQRRTAVGKEVINIMEAQGKLIAKPPGSTPDVFENINFGGSIRIERVRFTHPSVTNDAGYPANTQASSAIGFFTTFGQYSGSFLKSGSNNTQLVAIARNTTSPSFTFPLDGNVNTFVSNVNRHLTQSPQPTTPTMLTTSAPTKVEICLLSQTTKQRALIVIGEYGRQLSTNLTITDNITCP